MRLIRYLRSTLEEADRLTTKERLIENDDEQQHDERNRGDTGQEIPQTGRQQQKDKSCDRSA